MTLNDLPNRPNIKITKLPQFIHYYIEYENNGNLDIKTRLVCVGTCYQKTLPIMDDNHIYYFYSIEDAYMRYAEIEMSNFERKIFKNDQRKEKLKKLSEMFKLNI